MFQFSPATPIRLFPVPPPAYIRPDPHPSIQDTTQGVRVLSGGICYNTLCPPIGLPQRMPLRIRQE